jgi:Fe-S-cluster-containing dehydrogenase component
MDPCRRSFLKGVGLTALGAGCGAALLRAAGEILGEDSGDATPAAKQLGMVIDLEKCRSEAVRRACVEACHRAHNVPQIPDPEEEIKWIWSEKYANAFPDQMHLHTSAAWKETPVLVLCNHCVHPACVKVCPTKATWKRPQDGVIMMDMHRCNGCRYCIAACPYGARSFNWRDPRPHIADVLPEYPTRGKGVVEKCSFCEERLRDGRQPACVEAAEAAPGGKGAMTFGDLSDPDSNVSRLLREKYAICRRPSLGTEPSVLYIV